MAVPLIALEHVSVHLNGRRLLHDVSWELNAGEQWAIVGANGSGKSTLLRVIRGDLWPDRDGGTRRYALDGKPQAVGAAAPQIGYVSPELQERYTRLDLAIDGRTLIASGLHDSVYVPGQLNARERARVGAVVERFALEALAERPINVLSFGQLRMLLIARALVRAPKVLVLDECTNGLDRRARADLLAFLEAVAHGTQVICAAHRREDLPATITAHALIAGGRITATGAGLPPSRRSERTARPQPAKLGDVLIAIRDADVYRGETAVLRDVEWSIRRGEHCVVRGANGSGKSTFAGLVAGTIPPAHGAKVVRFGQRGPFDVWELKRRIAHVSDALQNAYDANPIVERVIASGFVSSIGVMHEPGIEERRIVADLMRRLDLAHLAGRRFLTLSFGERRKVLIARGLVHRPELLILDEVWAGLDVTFRSALGELLETLAAEGTTLMLISHHDDDLPPYLQREYVIENGRIA
ncbi:MAG TPA: ATP-binding cassette domain-containing protein [Candidatus Elarobacter sp.]